MIHLKRSKLFLPLILFPAFLIYINHFGNEFHFDDFHSIHENPYIRDIGNIPQFFMDCTTTSSMPTHQGYRPMVTTTLAIDYFLSEYFCGSGEGLNPFFYHVSNFSFFIFIIVLVFLLLKGLSNKTGEISNGFNLALIGALWFSVLTINAETINYIIARSDLLSTLGILGSFVLYIYVPGQRSKFFYLIPVALGMFAKESTIMFAPALVAYDFLIEKQQSLSVLLKQEGLRNLRSSIIIAIPAFLICISLALFSLSMVDEHHPGGSSVLWYALTQPFIVVHYFIQFFFPFGLTADTDIQIISSLSDDRFYIGLGFLAGLIYLIMKFSEVPAKRPAAFGLVWFLLMLLPTSSFIPLAEVANDHRPFLPNIGILAATLFIGFSWWNKTKRNRLTQYSTSLIAGGYLVLLSILTIQRNEVWKTEESLWKDVTIKSPKNGRGWMNFGLSQMNTGDYVAAREAFLKALPLTPYYHNLHTNLGILYGALGDEAEANKYFEQGIQYGIYYNEPYYFYARYKYSKKDYSDAAGLLYKSLSIYQGHINSLHLLMDVLYAQQNYEELRTTAQGCLKLYPEDSKALQYYIMDHTLDESKVSSPAVTKVEDLITTSLKLYYEGKYRECIGVCKKVLKIDPNVAEAYNNICSAYNQLMLYDSSIWACNKALELNPDLQIAKNNLQWATERKNENNFTPE